MEPKYSLVEVWRTMSKIHENTIRRSFDEFAKRSEQVAAMYWSGEYIAANIAASDILVSVGNCANKLTPEALSAFCNTVRSIEDRMRACDYYAVADFLAYEVPYILTKL